MKCFVSIKNIFFLFLLIAFTEQIFAQRVDPNRWIIQADGGITVFFGDVKRYNIIPDLESPSEVQPMFSLSVGKEISKIFSLRGQFLFGKLSGHKKTAKYHFKSDIMGANLLTDINLYYLFTGDRFALNRFNIYASIGVGYTSWDTKLYNDYPQPWGTDVASTNTKSAFSIPASLSMEYVFNKNFAVNAEGLLSITNSDEVDAVAGGTGFDSYVYANLGLVYKFSVKTKARKSRIKYALDPALYEPQPGDPQYVEAEVVAEEVMAEAEVTEVQEEEVQAEEVQENELTEDRQADAPRIEVAAGVAVAAAIDEEQESVVDTTAIAEAVEEVVPLEEVVAVEVAEADDFEDQKEINHELEDEAIQREVWVAKGEEAWPDIEFSVQVSASRVPLDAKKIQEDLGISETVYERNDHVWYRYSAGRYHKVWKAKEMRNILRSKHGVKDAFIVVYRNDKRISLVDALNFATSKQSIEKPEVAVATVDDPVAVEQVYPVSRIRKSIPGSGIMIGVQILAITNDEYPLDIFPGIYDIEKSIYFDKKKPWYRFIVGTFATYKEAEEFLPSARKNGFADAFIVAYKDGKKITIKQLKEELRK